MAHAVSVPAGPRAGTMTQSTSLETSEDAVLGGGLVLRQPRRGHRVGHDAILLAAATTAHEGERAIDLGAGVGAAGLALAYRVEGLAVTLVEIDPSLAQLGHDNAERNGLAARVQSVCLDVTASAAAFAAAGLEEGSADRVLMNSPFNTSQNSSPEPGRRLAHTGPQGVLRQWVRATSLLLGVGGVLTLIWRADGLDEVLTELASGFGALAILPVHPKPGVPAIRVLARAVKGNRAPLSLLPGFVLTDPDGKPSSAAEQVLRGGGVLPLAEI